MFLKKLVPTLCLFSLLATALPGRAQELDTYSLQQIVDKRIADIKIKQEQLANIKEKLKDLKRELRELEHGNDGHIESAVWRTGFAALSALGTYLLIRKVIRSDQRNQISDEAAEGYAILFLGSGIGNLVTGAYFVGGIHTLVMDREKRKELNFQIKEALTAIEEHEAELKEDMAILKQTQESLKNR